MMTREMKSETHAMERRVTCGQIVVCAAQGGKDERRGRAFVALKMEKVVLRRERTIREHVRFV